MKSSQENDIVKRMTTPPPELLEPPRSTYEAFQAVLSDLQADIDTQILTQSEKAKELWHGPDA